FYTIIQNDEELLLLSLQLIFLFVVLSVCQVEVKEGAESVLLPFTTTPELPGDVIVVWWCDKPNIIFPHVYKNGCDQPEEQDQFYRTRTKMNEDLLKTGDLSLTLRRPMEKDRGDYICDVFSRNIRREKRFHLEVKGLSVFHHFWLSVILIICVYHC
ncbi:hypothetical protein XENOCAPTIV_023331, partial [Xenoophorus captivus]